MLTEATLRALRPRSRVYRKADSAGLCVEVHPSGARYWRFRYRFAGRANMISLGVYPEVSLAQARRLRDAERSKLRNDTNPSAERRVRKLAARHAAANAFEPVAREWLDGRGDLAETTRTKLLWLFETYAFPIFGTRPISEVSPPEVLAALRRPESLGKLETASRLRALCGQVFRYAIATGRAERDPAADLRGALARGQVRHHASITDPARVGALLRDLDAFEGSFTVSCALKLSPLLFTRPGELRKAEWRELDLDDGVWRIPAERMKMRAPHVVPLSSQACAILQELQAVTGSGQYVFPSVRSRQRPLSENTVNAALRRLGYEKGTMTAHGFRSMASTLLNEAGWKPDVIERQLAHAERDQVRAAYNYAEHLPERRKMMQWWADHLDELRDGRGNVVPIKRKAAR